MHLSEKIQLLRKQRNLSQEQLAEELDVSRQAVSKWESDQSIPEMNNIIQLSEIFNVSTDYLLKENGTELSEGCSQLQTDDDKLRMKKSAMLLSTGVSIFGWLVAIALWLRWQTQLSLPAGIAMQLFALVYFEISINDQLNKNSKNVIRRHFYAQNLWIFLPLPMIGMVSAVMTFYPRPYSRFVLIVVILSLYLVFGLILTYLVKNKWFHTN
jgi:transcriptional regulator with XRE-family HTH domain